MKKRIIMLFVALTLLSTPNVWAENTARHGEISGKTVCFGLVSLLIWPGIGQYLNDNQTKKNVTHAVIGLFPLSVFGQVGML